jgi:uncharacterized protein with von Willebrand factor type A (vWA) domain
MLARLTRFLALLRAHGFTLGLGEAEDALRVARSIELNRPHELRRALKVLLCSRKADAMRFDELFDLHWLRRGVRQAVATEVNGRGKGLRRELSASNAELHWPGLPDLLQRGPGADAAPHGRRAGASTSESLAATDLRHIADPDEMARVEALAERLAARLRYRLTRRHRLAERGRQPDLRRTIRRNLAHGGSPIAPVFRRRRTKPLKLVLLLDASGSMSQYSALLVRFLKGMLGHSRGAEAFVFHTRLVHVSRALRDRDAQRAIERMALIATGWHGGTKIGASLATFNRTYAKQVIDRRTAVIVMSDGFDTDPGATLGIELAALRRRAHRIVWLNPMLGWPGYEPRAAGMTAALPHIDVFAPAHSLASLAALEPILARL